VVILHNIYTIRKECSVSGLIRYQVTIVYYVYDCSCVSNVIQRSNFSNWIDSSTGKFRQRRPVRVRFEPCMSDSIVVR